jgi:transposase
MAYPTKTREVILEYLAKGHTYKEARRELGVGISTIKAWKCLLNETGSLEKRPLERSAKKFHSEELENYIKARPEALLEDIAKNFGGSITGAHYACKRENITLKKRAFLHRKGREKAPRI